MASDAGGYRVEPARADDLALLPGIERAAAALFDGWGVEASVLADETSLEDFRRAHAEGLLWVARAPDAAPVGFAFVELVGGVPHLDELDVHPDHARRGLGRQLLETVAAWAAGAGHAVLTLTTFRDVPWNAPFYARAGFREIAPEEQPPALRALVREEAARGLDPARRCVMRRELQAP
jgi:GNAT superfamily N-acetyltransferase